MHDLILIFSRCEKKTKGIYQFHFKGFYAGEKINQLAVSTKEEDGLEVNNDYLLWAKKTDIINGVLEVRLIKYKKII